MALSKVNFYSGCNIVKNYTLDNYTDGYYFDKKLGQRVPISKGVNKYNKQFLIQLSDLNMQFFGLLRADSIMVKLLKMHEQTYHGDLNTLYNLMRAQGGTIRYNKLLKQALKTYEIRKQVIYDAIKDDLDKQGDRVKRNKRLLDELMTDFGFESLKEFIQNTTGRSIVDDIIQFSLDNNKNFDFKSLSSDKETANAEINAYYDKLDNEYIDYILKTAEQQGIELFKQISSSLEHHHNVREQMQIERKQREQKYKQEVKEQKTTQLINIDNVELNKLINDEEVLAHYAYYTSDDNNRYYKGLSGKTVTNIRKLVDTVGGMGYYIAICKAKTVNYIAVNRFNNSELKVTTSVLKADWFNSLDEAKEALTLVKKQSDLKDFSISIQKLQTRVHKKATDNIEGTIKKKVIEQIQFNKRRFITKVIASSLVNATTCEYNCKPTIKVIAYYKIGTSGDIDIKYLLTKKLEQSEKSLSIPYTKNNTQNEFMGSIGVDFSCLAFIVSDSNNTYRISKENKESLGVKGYKAIICEITIDISERLQEIREKQLHKFNEVAYVLINNNTNLNIIADELGETSYIHSEQMRKKIMGRLYKLKEQGIQTVYAVAGADNIGTPQFMTNKMNYSDCVSYNTAFFKTPEETIEAIKLSLDKNKSLVCTIFSLDLTQID